MLLLIYVTVNIKTVIL